ncbi:MAG: hypothetical protein ABI679_02815 [Gemmatimonadota bacterium]
MATRTEKASRRVAGRVKQMTKSAASASRRAAKVLDRVEKATRKMDSSRKVRNAKKAVGRVAKSAAVGAIAMGLREAAGLAGRKLTEMSRPKSSGKKKALKVAGAVVAVAGAAALATRAVKASRARRASPKPMEPESEMERGEE